MIAKSFCSEVILRLSFLHLSQSKIPTLDDIKKAAFSSLFKASDAFEAVNVLGSYEFLVEHYEKVIKAMNSKKWSTMDVSSLYRFDGFISKKAKNNPRLIFITDYFSSFPQSLSLNNGEVLIENFIIGQQEATSSYSSLYDNGDYYLFEKEYARGKKKKDIDFKKAIAKYCYVKGHHHFFVMIELLNSISSVEKEIFIQIRKKIEETSILELMCVNTFFRTLY